jgi:hypothetical protein
MRLSTAPISTPFFAIVLALAMPACGSSSGDATPEDTGSGDTSVVTSDADAGRDTATGDGTPGDGTSEGGDTAPCTPPKFGGITKIDGIDEKSVKLHWDAATDPTTSPTAIIYSAYGAASGTSIDFSKAGSLVTGKTEVVFGGLTKETTYFFVVRASNGVCQETNFVVRTATTSASCNFAAVQPIFDRNCAVSGCHVLPTPPQGLTLSAGFSYANTVNVDSVEDLPRKRVKPNDSEESYLYRKITGRPAAGTLIMPPPGATSFPTAEEKELIKCWIDHGALP